MRILFWGLSFFVLAFIIHFVLWKIRLPKRQIKAILQIFLAVLFVGISVLWNLPVKPVFWGITPPVNLPEYIQIFLFFFSLVSAYMITYSALEADSPSLVIVKTIVDAGQEGLDMEIIKELINNDVLIKPRVYELDRDKMIYMDKDKYRLTSKGLVMARIFVIYRKLLNITRKGG